MSKLPWIAFLGADGAGKSTIIDAVINHYSSEGFETEYHHWKPKRGGYDRLAPSQGVALDPHNQKARNPIASLFKIFALIAIWKQAFRSYIAHSRAQGKIILFDRFYLDLIVDPTRYRFKGSTAIARHLFKLMPQPSITILLHAPADVLLSRKQEVPKEALTKIVKQYERVIETQKNGVLIDASQPVEQVIQDTIAAINKAFKQS